MQKTGELESVSTLRHRNMYDFRKGRNDSSVLAWVRVGG